MVDLWLMQSQKYIDVALDEGFRKFTWSVADLLSTAREMFSWVRTHTAGYGPVRVMMIDHAGAAEYNTFKGYEKPEAVYPTWAPDEGWDSLEWLMQNCVGSDLMICTDQSVNVQMRPVYGQAHRVVIHRLPPGGWERKEFYLQLREVQLKYPEVQLFVSGGDSFSDIFGFGFWGVDYRPHELTGTGASANRVALPSGKQLRAEYIHDPRYEDWFELVGMAQWEIQDFEDRIRMCLRSADWARKNFQSVTPFITRSPSGRGGPNTVFMPDVFTEVSDRDFVLPAARRRVMRNIGMKADEYDRFTCDTCILQNACTLYREGSVCTVKGSDAVALADAFGSRNADVIMGGLSKLLQRNAERLEDAIAAEDASGELDPEVTKLSKVVFDQGTKLVKLIDPSKAGGPKVQVNVGVGAGGSANVGISGSDPKQLMATVVAELEAAGVKREDIDSSMVKGVLRNMANVPMAQAISTAKVNHEISSAKTIEGSAS
jgi:hypothetical protein